MGRNRGIGASLAQQLKTTAEVVSIRQPAPLGAAPISAAVEASTAWIAIFPRPGKEPQRVDLSYLSRLPRLGPALFEGYRIWGADKGLNSRYSYARSLKTGFCNFICDQGIQDISLGEITRPHLVAFIKWLDREDAVDGKPYRLKSRESLLQGFRAALQGLQSSASCDDAARVLRLLPKGNWPGASRKNRPRERLDRDSLRAIVSAAENEIRTVATMLDEGSALIAAGCERQPETTERRPLGTNSRNPYADQAVCLAALEALLTSSNQLIRVDTLKATNPTLFIAASKYKLGSLTRYLYPQSYKLVPIVILLTVAAALNAETAVTLGWAGIKEDEIFGAKVVRIEGRKKRAAVDPVLPLPAETVNGVGVGLILDILRRWTARLRVFATPELKDRLFLFSGIGDLPSTFGSEEDPHAATTGTWHTALKKWCADNGLKPFALSQIRTTVLDEVQQRTGDIMQARALGRHRDATTTWHHYTSDGTRKRYQERFGAVLLLRDRWLTSKGVIDPRERTEAQDKGAATPGFMCFDPYDSPQPGQKPGRLCSAYGRCPSCPLAAANVGDPTCVASYQALRRAIGASEVLMSPEVFRDQWHNVLSDVDALLSQVSTGVLQQAAGIRIQLPPVV